MRVLLDTHTFLWWINDVSLLSEPVRQIIADGQNEVFVSAATGWEIAIKVQIGKLRIEGDVSQFVIDEMNRNRFKTLPIQMNHTTKIAELPLLHKDPFDRILIVQSQCESLPLLTADSLISQYTVNVLW